jgi:hypothetical protein
MKAEMIAVQICIQARQPVHLWGEPGIGKTKQTEAIAAALDERLWPVLLAIREPSDQGGLPVIVRHEDGTSSVWMAPPRWAKEIAAEGKGQIHFDELNVSAPTVQNSALRVVNELWAGDQKLPDETSFIICGNPAETNPGVYDLTPAMANRVVHIAWPIDHEGWCDGMISGWKTQIVQLPKSWREGIEASNGLIVAFIRRRGNLLHAKPADPTEAGKAWPSPRTWTIAARLAAAANSMGYDIKSEVTRVLIAGCVGESACAEFMSYVVNLDLRDPEEYLADPMNIPLPTRQDQTMATLDQIAAAALREMPKRKDVVARYYAAWKVLGRVIKKAGDIAIPACRVMAVNMPQEAERNLPPEVEDILPMLEAAGIDFSQTV